MQPSALASAAQSLTGFATGTATGGDRRFGGPASTHSCALLVAHITRGANWGPAGMRPHPLGVQPLGNKLLGLGPQCCRSAGLGALAVLSDELLLHVLQHLSPDTLARLCTASRSTYAYCALEELWRAATLEAFAGDVHFCGSWRETYRRCATLAAYNAPREWRAHIHLCLQASSSWRSSASCTRHLLWRLQRLAVRASSLRTRATP